MSAKRARAKRKAAAQRKRYLTPVGTVASAQLTEPDFYGRYAIAILLSERDAATVRTQIAQAIREEVAAQRPTEGTAVPAGKSAEGRKQRDGSVVFRFKTSFQKPPLFPLLCNVEGHRIRKPENIVEGRRVSVAYTVTLWYEGGSRALLATPALEGVTLYGQKPRRNGA